MNNTIRFHLLLVQVSRLVQEFLGLFPTSSHGFETVLEIGQAVPALKAHFAEVVCTFESFGSQAADLHY